MTVDAPLTTAGEGSPLLTVQEGTVSGGLWYDSWPGFGGSAEKTFTLPDHTEIKWARLYTDVYCGLMSGNKSFSMTIDIDADDDGVYELQKHDAGSIVYSNTPAWVNDHVVRVTSDYFMWYDLTDDITGNKVNIKATGGGSDGRIKHVTLVVAYDDGDEEEIHYWVNQGHDIANYGGYTGSTEFGTSAISDPVAVNLSSIYCASVDGVYTFNGESLSSGGSAISGGYFGYDDWDVTEYFNSGQDSTLTYTNSGGGYYKIQVALMTASGTVSSGDTAPIAEFSATPTSGDSPLTVQFTDTSTNSPTSWAWDFGDGDDTNATMQNPVHVYVSEGTYTVNLTATNAYGSDTEVKTDYITVTSGGSTNGVDLSIGGTVNTQPSSAVFVWEPNTVVVSGITNSGSVVAQNVTLALYASDVSGTEPVNSTVIASLTGNEVTVTLIDPTIREFEGEDVTYTAVLDPENAIAEDDESNNNLTSEVKSVRYNGYKGKGIYWAGSDNGGNITTKHTFNLTGDIISSTQPESAYKSTGWLTRTETWTAADLPIPATATVQKAYLYVSYNWDTTPGGVPNITTTFNGNTIDLGIPYTDKSNFGTYADYKYGLYPAVDVTSIFNVSGNNTFVMTPNTGNSQALYPSTLVVVYSDPTETRKLIFINEECDELGVSQSSYGTTVEEATAYVEFSGLDIDLSMVQNATLHSFAGSAGPNEGNLLFNGQSIATDAWQGTYRTVSTQSFDVKPYLSADGNVAGVQGTTSGGMAALQQILVVETNYTTLPVLSFMPADATVIDGQTTEIVISVDSLPAGLAGYNLTVDIGDRNVSTIVNITYPEWVSVSENSTLPRGSIYLKALDGNDTIQAGATDVVLATLTVKGRNPGITNVTLGIDRLDDDNGDEIEALLETGNLEVTLMTIPGQTASAQDLDGDGIYEDLTGDGSLSFVDVELFFHQMDWIETHLPIANFDFNGNGRIDFDDVVDLFQMVM
jgi:PKD repeat protein